MLHIQLVLIHLKLGFLAQFKKTLLIILKYLLDYFLLTKNLALP